MFCVRHAEFRKWLPAVKMNCQSGYDFCSKWEMRRSNFFALEKGEAKQQEKGRGDYRSESAVNWLTIEWMEVYKLYVFLSFYLRDVVDRLERRRRSRMIGTGVNVADASTGNGVSAGASYVITTATSSTCCFQRHHHHGQKEREKKVLLFVTILRT